MSDIDRQIAEFYAPLLLHPFKYGDNAVAVWFPGSGRRTIVADIFSDTKILKKELGHLYPRTRIIYLSPSCNLAGTFAGFVSQVTSFLGKSVFKSIDKNISQGKELFIVVEGLDGYPKEEVAKIYEYLGKLAAYNGGKRVKILINTYDFPLFLDLEKMNPYSTKLGQQIIFCPMLDKSLLLKKISGYEADFKVVLNPSQKKEAIEFSGNVLTVIKHYVRNINNDPKKFALERVKRQWVDLPKEYREDIKKYYTGKNIVGSDLFKLNFNFESPAFGEIINLEDPEGKLNRLFTPIERDVFSVLKKNPGVVITRTMLMEQVYGSEPVSDWALDKVVSRLRKKMNEVGYEGKLETWKRRGYRWLG